MTSAPTVYGNLSTMDWNLDIFFLQNTNVNCTFGPLKLKGSTSTLFLRLSESSYYLLFLEVIMMQQSDFHLLFKRGEKRLSSSRTGSRNFAWLKGNQENFIVIVYVYSL